MDKRYVMLLRKGEIEKENREQCFNSVLHLLLNFSPNIRGDVIESFNSISEFEKLQGRRF